MDKKKSTEKEEILVITLKETQKGIILDEKDSFNQRGDPAREG